MPCPSEIDPSDPDGSSGREKERKDGETARKGYTSARPCRWQRKLCITCSIDKEGDVVIRVQGNGMPSHCFDQDADIIPRM